MRCKWLVEDYANDNSIQPLMDEIKAQGMDLEIVKYKPWESGEFNQYPNEDCVVFYGTLNLARQLQKQKGWIPGIICNFKNFYCHTYYSYWGKYLFNKDYMMLPMMELLRRKDELFKSYRSYFATQYEYMDGEDICYDYYIFIRPDSGAKPIIGQLLAYRDLEKEFELFKTQAGNDLDQIVIVISSPKHPIEEWRCVVVDKKVVAFSQYKDFGELETKREIPDKALCLANEIVQEEWQPDIAYTLDICRTTIDTYHLLEANSFSCSGLYKCDPEPIVREISKVATKEWEEYQ